MIYLFLFYAYNRFIVLDEETVFQLKFNLWLLFNCSIAIFYFSKMRMFLIAGIIPMQVYMQLRQQADFYKTWTQSSGNTYTR